MKNSRLKKLITSLVMVVMLATSVGSFTYAWFIFNKEVTVDHFDTQIEGTHDIEISADKNNWHKKDPFTGEDDPLCLEAEGRLSDVMSDGVTFFRPMYVTNNLGDIKQNGFEVVSEEEFVNNLYINQFYFRVDNQKDIYIANDTRIEPYDLEDEERFYNDVSKDYVAAATRVGFYTGKQSGSTINWTLRTVYIPNVNVHATYDSSGEVIEVDTNAEVESSFTFGTYDASKANKVDIWEIKTNGENHGSYIKSNIKYIWGDLENLTQEEKLFITSAQISTYSDGIIPIKIVIWIDGYDNECNASFLGGMIKANLSFERL